MPPGRRQLETSFRLSKPGARESLRQERREPAQMRTMRLVPGLRRDALSCLAVLKADRRSCGAGDLYQSYLGLPGTPIEWTDVYLLSDTAPSEGEWG